MNNAATAIQGYVNRAWVFYDKYDRSTWPQIPDGKREALCELENGSIKISAFYLIDGDPDWVNLEPKDKVIRFTDLETFKFKEN